MFGLVVDKMRHKTYSAKISYKKPLVDTMHPTNVQNKTNLLNKPVMFSNKKKINNNQDLYVKLRTVTGTGYISLHDYQMFHPHTDINTLDLYTLNKDNQYVPLNGSVQNNQVNQDNQDNQNQVINNNVNQAKNGLLNVTAPQVNTNITIPNPPSVNVPQVEPVLPQYHPNIKPIHVTAPTIDIGIDYDKLAQDIYAGIKSKVNEQEQLETSKINEMLANAGVYRSGINVANKDLLAQKAMNALAQGWGQTALGVAQLRTNVGIKQAELQMQANLANAANDLAAKTTNAQLAEDLAKTSAQIQNSVNLANAHNLLQAKINEYNNIAQNLRLQGQMQQAAEFQNAANSLKAQIANQAAALSQWQSQLASQTELKKTGMLTDTQKQIAQWANQTTLKKTGMLTDTQKQIAQTEANARMAAANAAANAEIAAANTRASAMLEAAKNEDATRQAIAQLEANTKLQALQQQLAEAQKEFNSKLKTDYDKMTFALTSQLMQNDFQAYLSKLNGILQGAQINAQFGDENAKTKWNDLLMSSLTGGQGGISYTPPQENLPSPKYVKNNDLGSAINNILSGFSGMFGKK